MTTCLICLDDTFKKELYVTTCNHIFHKSCLLNITDTEKIYNYNDELKFTTINCPLCRKKLSIPKIFKKQISCSVLDDKIFSTVKSLYNKINDFNLNKQYLFITGFSAKILHNIIFKMDNINDINNICNFSDYLLSSNICYIDYDNLYNNKNINILNEKYVKNLYETEYYNYFIKDIKIQKKHRIIYLSTNNYCGININKHIQTHFDHCKISCYKIGFMIKDNYIDFFIHSDFYKDMKYNDDIDDNERTSDNEN